MLKRNIKLLAIVLVVMVVSSIPAVVFAKEFQMIVVPKLRAPWFNYMEQGLKEAAKDFGMNVTMQAPASPDEALQVKMIEDAITKGVDAIGVVPNDAKSLEPVFAKAKAKGIIIITHESPDQKNHDYDVEMIDNIKYGEHGIDKLVEYMGTDDAEYALYVGSLTVPLHNLWADASEARAKAKYPKLKLVTPRVPCAEDQSLAKQKGLELLKAYPNLKGFLTYGSQGAPGAAQAVREKGLIGKVHVCGGTTPNQGRQYIKDGSLDYSFIWSSKEAGYAMVYVAKLMLEKKAITDGLEIPKIGKAKLEGTTVKFDRPMGLTKENIDQYDF